ncbi:unnamed protein product [Moneuplotes crassus]|uniref:Uncharacterized protein n=1 Tax=Euplotes crassus TaxID=5936 RepID=A0AAD1UFZ6_EUPCR|nr:unnamed protein product [Moneuplotes crassus]
MDVLPSLPSSSNDWNVCDKYIGAVIILLCILCCLFLIFVYYSCQFIKIMPFHGIYTDRMNYFCILMFLLMINLAISLRICYFSTEIYLKTRHCKSIGSKTFVGIFTYLPVLVFISAVIFSTFSWIYQSRQINEYFNATNRFRKKCTNIWLIISQCMLLIIIIVNITLSFVKENNLKLIYSIFRLVVTFYFISTSICYAWAVRYYYLKLNLFSPKMSQKIKKRVICSILFVSIPLLVRGINNISRYILPVDKIASNSLKNNTIWWPAYIVLYFTLTDFVPMITLMLGMKTILHHCRQNKESSLNLLLNKKSSQIDTTDMDNFKSTSSLIKEGTSFSFNNELSRNAIESRLSPTDSSF